MLVANGSHTAVLLTEGHLMNSQIHYLIAQHRTAELCRAAEQARRASAAQQSNPPAGNPRLITRLKTRLTTALDAAA